MSVVEQGTVARVTSSATGSAFEMQEVEYIQATYNAVFIQNDRGTFSKFSA